MEDKRSRSSQLGQLIDQSITGQNSKKTIRKRSIHMSIDEYILTTLTISYLSINPLDM